MLGVLRDGALPESRLRVGDGVEAGHLWAVEGAWVEGNSKVKDACLGVLLLQQQGHLKI